jgi:hypothetical protein
MYARAWERRAFISTQTLSYIPRIQASYAKESCCERTYIYLALRLPTPFISCISSFAHQLERVPSITRTYSAPSDLQVGPSKHLGYAFLIHNTSTRPWTTLSPCLLSHLRKITAKAVRQACRCQHPPPLVHPLCASSDALRQQTKTSLTGLAHGALTPAC